MTMTEAARALGISRQAVHMLARKAGVRPLRVGPQYVVTEGELARLAAWRAVPRKGGRPRKSA